MVMIFTAIFLTFSSLFVTCLADWTGVYNDPIYGGNMHICVSDINGVLYGQGVFSKLGYMRGTITVGDVFTGEFWLQGWESTHGTFSLTLSGSSYSGTFTQLPGITYSVSGTKSSSNMPSDLECYRSDDYLLTTTDYYSSTGTYVPSGEGASDAGVISNAIQESETGRWTTVGSYQYVFSSNGDLVHGTEYTTSFLNGQVKAGRWSEPDAESGIMMYIAKNSTFHYTAWWYIRRLAEFNYSFSLDPDYQGQSMMEKVDPSTLPSDSRSAVENVCLELFTVDDENTCFGNFNSDTAEDDDSVESAVGVSSMVFSVFGFVAILIVGMLILVEVRKINSAAPSTQAGAASTTTNELHKDKL